MKKHIIISTILLLSVFVTHGQQKLNLTDDQIFKGLPENVVNDVPHAYEFTDNSHLLMYLNGFYYYDINNGTKKDYSGVPGVVAPIPQLVEGWLNPTYSPDSSKIAYTLRNDLYSIDVKTKEIVRHTFDGTDLILNGYASWVYYEEIFGRPSKYKAFWWSPDSKIIAFYRFDNTKVPMFPIYIEKGKHGYLNQTRYPQAGDENPEVKIGFVSAGGGEIVWSDFNEKDDQYFGTPFWNATGDRLMVSWMPRSQDDLILYSVDPLTGNKLGIYTEHQNSWIDWMDQILFTSEGMYIVRDYEMWEQIYFLSYDGNKFDRLSDGGHNWSTTLLKVTDKYLYYTCKREATTRYDIYRITLKNKKTERISYGEYNFSNIHISPDNRTIYADVSNSKTPLQGVLITIPKNGDISKKSVKVIADAKGSEFDKYKLATPDIIEITLRDGSKVPASVIWPLDMDKNKKYPVKVDIYGGPNTPQVFDKWSTPSFRNQWWANHGVIQVILETRSGGHQGKTGLNSIYRQLNIPELQDFIDGIKYFDSFPYVNIKKVGIEGYSYGGTMTVLAVTEGNDYFQYGVGSSGVMDWELYDSHYTERYMDTPQDNPDGYKATNVYNRLGSYKGDDSNMLRLTHGTGDDNVHFQNSLKLIDQFQKEGKDFELMIYPQGMHGYRGYQNDQFKMQNYKFWYKYLLDSEIPGNLKDYFIGKYSK